jgi:hypothetical protein
MSEETKDGAKTGTGETTVSVLPVAQEKDPNGINSNDAGAKLDFGKPKVRTGLLEQFPRACMAVAEVSEFGAGKYTWGGWQHVENGIERYGDAGERHVCKAIIEGEIDSESGLLHAAHEAWNSLARLELILRKSNATNELEPKQEQNNG